MNPTLFLETPWARDLCGEVPVPRLLDVLRGLLGLLKNSIFSGVFAGETKNYQIVRLTGVVQKKSPGTGEN